MLIIYRSILLKMRNISDKFVDKFKTHILCSTTYFLKSRPFLDNVEKFGRPEQATDDIMVHAHCMLDN